MTTVRYWECPKHGVLAKYDLLGTDWRTGAYRVPKWLIRDVPDLGEQARCGKRGRFGKCKRKVKEIIQPIESKVS